MTVSLAVRRRNTWLALLAGLVAVSLVPVAAWVAGTAITESSAAVNVGGDTVLEIPPTPVGVISMVDGTGGVTSITAFALAPEGSGGTVLSLPVGSRVRATVGPTLEGEPVGGARVADVYAAEGPEAYQREVSSLLNTSIAFHEVVSVDLATALLQTAGVPSTVLDVVIEASLTQGTVAEQERWDSLADAWGQLVEAVGDGEGEAGADPRQPAPDDLTELLEAVFRGPVTYHPFALTPVLSMEANPTGSDLYDLDRSEVVLVMASVAPSAVVAANPSVAVQIDSDFDFATTRRAVAGLLYVGANVLLVRQVDTPAPQTTQVRTSVRLSDDDIDAFETLFGAIEVMPAEQEVEGIDVQIRLGAAFAATQDQE